MTLTLRSVIFYRYSLMRILLINWRDIRNPRSGGAEVHLHEIFSRIAGQGYDVTLLSCKFSGAKTTENIDGIEVMRYGGESTFNLTVPWFLRKHLAHRVFDIIIEDINKIPFLLPWFFKEPPVMVLLHHLFGRVFYRETNPVFATYLYFMERLIPHVYRHCFIEVVSESCRDELLQMGMLANNISVVHNGLNTRFIEDQENKIPKEPGLIVYLGRLKKYKNVDHLIQAMTIVHEEVPGARLVIVGTGNRRQALESMTRALGLVEVVEFAGYLTETDKFRLLRRAEVAAYPSTKEGWGITVIEANACGVPVVATRVPGLCDAVIDGETGLLTPLGNPEAMAGALVRLLRDTDERERLGQNALMRSRSYSWEDTARETLQIIERIIGRKTNAV